MSPPPLQATRFDRLQRRLGELLLGGFSGSWRRRSLAVLALLLGFYIGQNVTALWLEQIGRRPQVVLVLVVDRDRRLLVQSQTSHARRR